LKKRDCLIRAVLEYFSYLICVIIFKTDISKTDVKESKNMDGNRIDREDILTYLKKIIAETLQDQPVEVYLFGKRL